jgi:predicted dehydrogenase
VTTSLIVGGGSIAIRHARLLGSRGLEVAFVSARPDLPRPTFPSVADALLATVPDYVVIANETSLHGQAVSDLARTGFSGRVLIEKPAAVDPAYVTTFSHVGVAYNLRFHPVIARVRELLESKKQNERILQVEAYAGQWLPDWRPDRPVKQQYSAHASRGGGVLRDLSHELDLLQWLFGKVTGVFALGGRIGDVTVDSDDSWNLILEHLEGTTTSLQLNYFDRPGARLIRVVTSERTINANLSSSTVTINGETSTFEVERDDSYITMHLDMLETQTTVATIQEAAETDALILDIERSARHRKWKER